MYVFHNNYKVFRRLPKSHNILLDKNNLEAYKLINLGTYEKRGSHGVLRIFIPMRMVVGMCDCYLRESQIFLN